MFRKNHNGQSKTLFIYSLHDFLVITGRALREYDTYLYKVWLC